MRNKVGYYRNQRGLTLQQLSKLTGLSVAAISKIENDNTNDILLKNAIVLSRALKVDMYELFCISRWGGDNMDRQYYNVICEEISILGGKVIHIDTNVGSLDEVHEVVSENVGKYPNGKWELYPMIITM